MRDLDGAWKSMTDRELVGNLVDPPSGWMWGFPKVFNPQVGETLEQWLVREGYPPTEVDFALRHLRVIYT